MRNITISGVPKAQNRNGSEISWDFVLAMAIGRLIGSRMVFSFYGPRISAGLGGFRGFLLPFEEPAERFARPRQTRAHGPDRDAEDLGGFVVAEPFEADEQYHFALLYRQAGERLFELAALTRRGRIADRDQRRRYIVDIDHRSLADGLPHDVDVQIVHQCEKPRPQVGTLLP